MLAYSNVARQFSVFLECLSDDGNNIPSAAERLVARRPMKTIWKRTFTTNSYNFTNCWKLIWENRLSNNTNLLSP